VGIQYHRFMTNWDKS